MTSAEQAFALHQETGVPVLKCQQALQEVGGDPAAAMAVLLKQYRHVDPSPAPGFWEQFKAMPRDKEHNPDPNENAARIVKEAIAGTSDATPASVEAACS